MWLERLRRKKTDTKYEPEEMARRINELNYGSARDDIRAKKFFYWLRNVWGVLLALVLIASIAFEFWLAYQVGKGHLSFTGYTTFLNIIAGTDFIQIVGLCALVVGFLFPKNKQ